MVDILIVGLVVIPILVWLWCWTKGDIEKYDNMVAIDPKTGKVISRFKDWREGRE